MTKPSIVLCFLCTASCTSQGMDASTPVAMHGVPLQGGVAEFRVTSFDGVTVKGRVLLGATKDTLVIDGRLNEWSDVEVRDIRACESKEVLRYYQVDRHVQPPQPNELVTLRPGYWYGADLSFLFFGTAIKQAKPECFEGELIVWAEGRRIAARRPIRVVRTDKSPPATSP